MRLSILLAALGLCPALAGPAAAQSYDQCGRIVQGITCPLLFLDDQGALWLLDDYGSFGLDDLVRVSGTAEPGCITICNQGNGCIFGNTIGPCGPLGTAYCFCPTVAPCGNTDASAGCANTTGAGATLQASGSSSAAADDLELSAGNLLPAQPALLFVGTTSVNGGNGIVFGDGLRCAATNVVRLGTQVPDAQGGASWGPGLRAQGGWSSGDTRYFQVWYRDPAGGGACGNAFNLSHGVEVGFGA
jgi:hypothetical protein